MWALKWPLYKGGMKLCVCVCVCDCHERVEMVSDKGL